MRKEDKNKAAVVSEAITKKPENQRREDADAESYISIESCKTLVRFWFIHASSSSSPATEEVLVDLL